ncbi:MAG TPA: T9SS type A sorting domain-containing protein [Mariniphaga anaerophila]|uniref:T9SS type A sorting domain-containing protein n=1 Tax=Mariniphaga anaerophila TaxID=1484053 RepID=A0A831LIA4_9BACT|nr:T9SS type A sorting domain-containing protein [Mariniphaga anaerophila]
MKLKLLLFSMFFTGIIHAQVVCEYPEGVITTLVITEARFQSPAVGYIELTNLGDEPVNLKEFKLGRLTPWSRSSSVNDLCNDPWYTETGDYMFLPDRVLEPGESFVITNAYDYGPVHYKEGLGRLGGSERPKQIGMYEVADKLLHMQEPIDEVVYPGDSVTTALNDPEQTVRRGDYRLVFDGLTSGTYYIEHHYTEGDSAVVDQVGGVFDGEGKNYPGVRYDVAGVKEGVQTSILVRKNIVKTGNLDFANARGINLEDSEWIPIEIPDGYDAWRDVWWTIGNHGNYVLDENTLESTTDEIKVDFAGKKITVPWGTRRLDEIMRNMKKKDGVAWNYVLNDVKEDSLYRSARNGDKLVVYVVGNGLTTATFDIIVEEPTTDANMVVPVDHANMEGPVTTRAQNGILSWPRVTKNESGIDTITGSGYGLAFDLRTDSLLKYLEKPANATWEFVWVDGVERPDLKNGDKLRVTSQSGNVKEYFIQVQTYFPSRNANLSAITWPDIPNFYKGFMGWMGDTIPNFSPGATTYRVEVPLDVEGMPAFVAKTQHVNASVKTTRAKSLTGTVQDRTVTFEVTAEDDTVSLQYNVELVKEKHPDKIEPFKADPFISEFVNSYPNGNAYLELYNPGNQSLDLRDYMVGMRGSDNLYAPVVYNAAWNMRYTAYHPGLKYVDEQTWEVTPRILLPDVNVNPIIQGGETFVLALITRGDANYPGIQFPKYDVQFANENVPGHPNPWNEEVRTSSSGGVPIPPNGNRRNVIFLYKVLNDSIKLGLKPNTDPNDFELIDIWGMPERAYWIVGDYVMRTNETGNIFIRKPEINQGNPKLGGSFGIDNPDNVEWNRIQPGDVFGNISTPERYLAALGSLGTHFMIEPTFYKSTVTSSVYKVSDGFGPGEEIMGVRNGTTVTDFLGNINKEDEGQTLTVKSGGDDSVLAMDAVLNMNDVLVVLSADSTNTTIYRLDVTETGLSSDAVLTSTRWTISIEVSPKSAENVYDENDGVGSVTGFEYGTGLKSVINNITVPAGATMTVIDSEGSYVPFKTLNFDTAYVNVTVNPDIYLDVVAEDGITRIVYQLKPVTSENDAFILSDVYTVSQVNNLVQYVPRGTNVQAFFSNITPSLGASIKLVDKMGFERTQGNIREDDKVVVTSSNGQVTKVYFISFLPTATITSTTYLAYVLSNSYAVNQVEYVISGSVSPLTGTTLISEFYSRINPAIGATAAVVDAEGNEKTSGNLNQGDKLKVTSADGKIIVYYQLELDVTSTINPDLKQIEIYPNPASGLLNINGVDAGNRIQLFSMEGKLLSDIKAQSNRELISLEKIPSGLFLIVISNENQMLGRYKALKR